MERRLNPALPPLRVGTAIFTRLLPNDRPVHYRSRPSPFSAGLHSAWSWSGLECLGDTRTIVDPSGKLGFYVAGDGQNVAIVGGDVKGPYPVVVANSVSYIPKSADWIMDGCLVSIRASWKCRRKIWPDAELFF
jgi:hypothetical protein